MPRERRQHPSARSSMDRALVFGTKGCRFESCRAWFGNVAVPATAKRAGVAYPIRPSFTESRILCDNRYCYFLLWAVEYTCQSEGAQVMNVSLTRELEALVQEKVRSGLYRSASEVVREALRLLHERERLRELRLRELRREIAVGVGQADRGDTAPLNVDRLKKKARRRKAGR